MACRMLEFLVGRCVARCDLLVCISPRCITFNFKITMLLRGAGAGVGFMSPNFELLELLHNHSKHPATYTQCGLSAVALLNATMHRLAHLPNAGLANQVSMVAATSPPLRNVLQSDYGDWSLCREIAKNTVDAAHPTGHAQYCKVHETYWLSSAACVPTACSPRPGKAWEGEKPQFEAELPLP